MRHLRWTPLVGVALLIGVTTFQAARAGQPYGGTQPRARAGMMEPPTVPDATTKPNNDADFYGVGYVAPWQPASGVHWRRNARLEYYARPPAPTWRWFTTGRGCGYDKGIVYGVTYPQIPTYPYEK